MSDENGNHATRSSESGQDSVSLPVFIFDLSPFRRAHGSGAMSFDTLLESNAAERQRIASEIQMVSVNEEGGRLLAERMVPGEGYIPWERLDDASWNAIARALEGFLLGRTIEEFPVSFSYPGGVVRSYTLRLQLPDDAQGDWSRVVACFTHIDQQALPPPSEEGQACMRRLFSNMILGFAYVEAIQDEKGNPVDFRFLSVNPAFERITGFKGSLVIGRTARELLPELEDHWILGYGDVVRTGRPFFLQGYTMDKERYFDVWAYRPSLGRLATLVQDVSEREKNIHLVHEQRVSLDLALDAAGAGTWSLDMTTRRFDADERCASLLGRTKTEIGTDEASWEAFFYPDDLVAYRDQKRRCLSGEMDRYECEMRGRHRDGRWLWFLERGRVVERDPSGSPLRMIGTLINQDRRKRAELEASEKGSRLACLLDSLDDVAFFTDREGVLQGCNRALEKLLGRPSSELMGKSIDDVFNPELVAAMRGRNEAVLESKKPVRAEEWHRSVETGQWMLLEVYKNPLRDEEGRIVGIVSVARNITERHDLNLITTVRLALLEKSRDLSSSALSRFALEELERVTESAGGFLYSLGKGQRDAELIAWHSGSGGAMPPQSLRLTGKESSAVALCAQDRRVLLYNDARADPRSPVFEELPGYSRCVLAPILRSNHVIAVLGVADKEEAYSDRDVSLIAALVDQIWDVIATQLSNEKRAESEWLRETALNVTKAGFWSSLVSTGEGVMDERCAGILGREPPELSTNFVTAWKELCHPDDLDGTMQAMGKYLKGESSIFEVEMRMRHRDGRWIWVLDRGEVIERDASGLPVRVAGILIDVTRLKESEIRLRETLADKDALLHELHHRNNNTMQLINAMLEFKKAELDNDLATEGFNSVQNKIIAISLVQEKLFQANSLSNLDLGDFLRDLTGLLGREMLSRVGCEHSFVVDAQSAIVSIDAAIPCGIIVTELIENAVRHAFPPGVKGIVRVSMTVDKDGRICLSVSDNGGGPPEGFDPRTSKKMGLRTVIGIAEEQLRGTVRFHRTEEGFFVSICFKDTIFPKRV